MQLDNEIKLEKITLYTATQIYDTKIIPMGYWIWLTLLTCYLQTYRY